MDRYVFAWTVTIGRRGTGRAINPSRVEFRRPEAHRRLYENYFACPVRFGARRNKVLPRGRRKSAIRNAQSGTARTRSAATRSGIEAATRRQSLEGAGEGYSQKLLAGQKPRLEDVAVELRVSIRTLQRHLLEEGITFHDLVEEARREMAQHYLSQPSLELNETAYLLGYEDPNSFIRAFHKWEGTSPGEWRSTHCPSAA
jgi:AraC-like DNA-binding protein